MSGVCPFARGSTKAVTNEEEEKETKLSTEDEETEAPPTVCPFARGSTKAVTNEEEEKETKLSTEGEETEAPPTGGGSSMKCPLGFDSQSFKLGPLSCVVCHALLFESIKCVPCGHIYCRACITRFNDCPLCGADIEKVESDAELQKMVDQFIEGHARIKRPVLDSSAGDKEDGHSESANVVYEDVSLARGTFLLQQAMRAFQGQNFASAMARLSMCAEDIREELARGGATPVVCSQLGAVLGMLGDSCRSIGNSEQAADYYSESIEMLSSLPNKDAEVVHALSVSLNKLGDLKYYAEDLKSARKFYARALEARKNALIDNTTLSSHVLDVAVSLAKVADVDRALSDEKAAIEGFQEAVKTLEGLSLAPNTPDSSLEARRISVLAFLHDQLNTKPE